MPDATLREHAGREQQRLISPRFFVSCRWWTVPLVKAGADCLRTGAQASFAGANRQAFRHLCLDFSSCIRANARRQLLRKCLLRFGLRLCLGPQPHAKSVHSGDALCQPPLGGE